MASLTVYIAVVTGIFCCSCAQLLLKRAAVEAGREGAAPLRAVFNVRALAGYAVMFGAMVVNIWAFNRGLQLKELAAIESLGYIFVPVIAAVALGERLTLRTAAAIALIISGIFVFYI